MRYAQKYPEKVAAHQAVWLAKRTGKLKQEPCRDCGNPNTQAHHPDYSKKLEVVWLCQKHNGLEHRRLNQEVAAYKANEFRIWREGRSVDWQCTLSDLVEATGIEIYMVARIVKARGWQVVTNSGRDIASRFPVDTLMRMNTEHPHSSWLRTEGAPSVEADA